MIPSIIYNRVDDAEIEIYTISIYETKEVVKRAWCIGLDMNECFSGNSHSELHTALSAQASGLLSSHILHSSYCVVQMITIDIKW
jgi:hypothetical protein